MIRDGGFDGNGSASTGVRLQRKPLKSVATRPVRPAAKLMDD